MRPCEVSIFIAMGGERGFIDTVFGMGLGLVMHRCCRTVMIPQGLPTLADRANLMLVQLLERGLSRGRVLVIRCRSSGVCRVVGRMFRRARTITGTFPD